jgi:hypothetical protein
LGKLRELTPEVDPIKVLRARAYQIPNASFLIRAATLGKNGKYFFGLNYITAEEMANLENSFIIFICGAIENSLILPSTFLISHLPNISHDRNGEYKINIDSDLRLILSGKNNRVVCT